MLKLADLAPVILDALAEDRITTEHCQALALENDTARQVQVFEAACQSGWGGKPDVRVIRNLITESEVAVAGNSKFRFVGADAFSPDELRTDLFSDNGDGYVDRVALDAALMEKLQAVAEHLREAEGWEWCAGRMEPVGECREDAGTYRCLPEPEAVLTEAEDERLNELMTRYDALENQCEESDLLEAEMKLMRCMAKVRAWTPEMRTGSGVVVSWRYGNVCVQRGVQLRSEDDAADDADRTEQVQEKASVEEISLPLLTKMSSERTLAVQAALMQQPDKSLTLLAWTLCLNVFGSGAYSKPAQISLECEHYSLSSDAPSGKEGAAGGKSPSCSPAAGGMVTGHDGVPVTQPGGTVIPAQFLHRVQHPRRSDPRVWSHVTQSAGHAGECHRLSHARLVAADESKLLRTPEKATDYRSPE